MMLYDEESYPPPPPRQERYELSDEFMEAYRQYHASLRAYWDERRAYFNVGRAHYETERRLAEERRVEYDRRVQKKAATVRRFATMFNRTIFIETGTYMGDMVVAVEGDFKEIYTIEVAQSYYEMSRKRLSEYEHVTTLVGDSASELRKLLKLIDAPTILWLDAHYSGGDTGRPYDGSGTAIQAELGAVFGDKNRHVVLIDDARNFKGGREECPDFPTLEWVEKIAFEANYAFSCSEDIVRLLPREET